MHCEHLSLCMLCRSNVVCIFTVMVKVRQYSAGCAAFCQPVRPLVRPSGGISARCVATPEERGDDHLLSSEKLLEDVGWLLRRHGLRGGEGGGQVQAPERQGESSEVRDGAVHGPAALPVFHPEARSSGRAGQAVHLRWRLLCGTYHWADVQRDCLSSRGGEKRRVLLSSLLLYQYWRHYIILTSCPIPRSSGPHFAWQPEKYRYLC